MKDITITLNGKEIEVKPFNYVVKNINEIYFEMEFYLRIGDNYYFRSKTGTQLIVESDGDLHKHIKYGQIIDLDFN